MLISVLLICGDSWCSMCSVSGVLLSSCRFLLMLFMWVVWLFVSSRLVIDGEVGVGIV